MNDMNDKRCINLHHACLRVADVAEAFDRYGLLLGLHGERTGECAIMRCMHEDYCLVLKPAGTSAPGLEYVAYELVPGLSLQAAQAELARRGAAAAPVDVPVRGGGLSLRDPDGNGVVLVERLRPADARSPVMIETRTLGGYHPRRLGHVNYLTSSAPRVAEWYMDVLGFQLTDWIGEGAVWLHVDARHHVLAFLDKGYAHVHHLAFELADWGEMRVALDHIAKHGRWVPWGPLRHGMAQNLASYWRMVEEELFIELYCDMQILDEDHVPVTHPDNAYSSNTWGTLPPRSYFRFDAESIRKESESAQSYAEV